MTETGPNSVPQGLRGPLWGPLLAATVPTACVPALVTRWVLVPLLQQRRARFDVCCRVRPLIRREIERGWAAGISTGPVARPGEAAPSYDRECGVSLDAEENPTGEPSGELFTPGNVTVSAAAAGQTFDLDSVVTGTDQALPFAVVRPYVERFVDRAEPGAVVAYGQTAAGKTHTILGDPAEGMEGAAVRGVRLVLERLAATNGCHQSERRVLLVSMYEIYLEALRDLTPTPADIGAAPSDGARAEVDAFVAKGRWAPPCHCDLAAAEMEPTRYRDMRKKTLQRCGECRETFVIGSTPLYVDSTATFDAALECAMRQRTATQAQLGALSSQGHFIISLRTATIRPAKQQRCGESCSSNAWFDFVDCAGSEMLRLNLAAGAKQSLASLGNVARAIAANSQHVPFRESVLTQLLRRSALANTSRTLFFVCVSPADYHAEESATVLRFARTAQGPDSTRPSDGDGGFTTFETPRVLLPISE